MASSFADDLAELSLPPPLKKGCEPADLPAIASQGGSAYTALVANWSSALGLPPLSPSAADSTSSPERRAHVLTDLVAEAQAQHILASRDTRTAPASADPAALARQRGALTACCAVLRVAPPSSDEAPAQTLERLKVAAEKLTGGPGATPTTAPVAPVQAPALAAPPPAAEPPAPPSGTLLGVSDLSAEELATLEQVAGALRADHATRRAMLIKRLEVLCSTFMWSERASSQKEDMQRVVAEMMERLPPAAAFGATDAFAAGTDLLELQRATSLVGVTGGQSVKKVRIGRVPDRGGRANESFFERETFSFQEYSRNSAPAKGSGKGGAAGGKGKGGGRGAGGGGGGRGGGRGGGGRRGRT